MNARPILNDESPKSHAALAYLDSTTATFGLKPQWHSKANSVFWPQICGSKRRPIAATSNKAQPNRRRNPLNQGASALVRSITSPSTMNSILRRIHGWLTPVSHAPLNT